MQLLCGKGDHQGDPQQRYISTALGGSDKKARQEEDQQIHYTEPSVIGCGNTVGDEQKGSCDDDPVIRTGGDLLKSFREQRNGCQAGSAIGNPFHSKTDDQGTDKHIHPSGRHEHSDHVSSQQSGNGKTDCGRQITKDGNIRQGCLSKTGSELKTVPAAGTALSRKVYRRGGTEEPAFHCPVSGSSDRHRVVHRHVDITGPLVHFFRPRCICDPQKRVGDHVNRINMSPLIGDRPGRSHKAEHQSHADRAGKIKELRPAAQFFRGKKQEDQEQAHDKTEFHKERLHEPVIPVNPHCADFKRQDFRIYCRICF